MDKMMVASQPRRRTPNLLATTALAALCIGVAGGSLSALASSAPQRAEIEAQSIDEYDLALLHNAARDTFPESIDLDGLGIDGIVSESLRNLGSRDGHTYWVGFDKSTLLCFIITADIDHAGTSSCATVEEFSSRGIPLQTFSENQATEAYLIPDMVAGDREYMTSGIGEVANVLITDPLEPSSELRSLLQRGEFTHAELPVPNVKNLPPLFQKQLE